MKKLIITALIFAAPLIATAQSNEPITIELPSKKINGTKLKMKAELFTMLYNQTAKHLVLNWKVSYYADSFGFYGPKIDLPGIATYSKESIANNLVMVKPATGEIVDPDSTGVYPAISLIGQYDFFYYLAENENINVHDLIRAYGAAVKNW